MIIMIIIFSSSSGGIEVFCEETFTYEGGLQFQHFFKL